MPSLSLCNLNKKFILSTLTSSVFITSCTISAIWFYLLNIDRLDVFFDTISISSSLGVIFCFILLSLLGFSSLVFIASIMLIFIYTSNEMIFIKYTGIAHRIASVCYINSLFICLVLVSGFSINYYLNWDEYAVTITSVILIVIFSYSLTNWRILKAHTFLVQDIGRIDKPIRNKGMKFFLPLCLVAPGVVQILPLLFLINQIEFNKNTSDFAQLTLFLLVSSAFITMGILPGAIHISERKSGNRITSIIMGSIFIPVALVALSMLVRPIPSIIINMAMNLSGVSDWRTHQYYIETTKHTHSMFNGTLWNTRYYKGIPDRFFITGINIFSLGDVKLICPIEIREAKQQSFKDSPVDQTLHDKKIKSLKGIAMKCIPFNKNDIHTWDSPLSEPIYYEKVKVTAENSMVKILHALK